MCVNNILKVCKSEKDRKYEQQIKRKIVSKTYKKPVYCMIVGHSHNILIYTLDKAFYYISNFPATACSS